MKIANAKFKKQTMLGPGLGLGRWLSTDPAATDRKLVHRLEIDTELRLVMIQATKESPTRGVPLEDFEYVEFAPAEEAKRDSAKPMRAAGMTA